ncbi:protein of unknown function [Geodermatophilus obscurus]|uniref:Uncharacterized protein n=1 Tax=Geodermatophilus obscurus TaxID=1861 RepID=A0A1M7TVZ0_9ACTN|nr:protein of unknown function [Geodermatophilus obscurus]
MTAGIVSNGLRRTTGGLLLGGVLAFAGAATMLSSTFDWPDILREPAAVVLPAFAAGGTGLVWTWLATAWTYAVLAVPILLLPAVLSRRDDPVLWAATCAGATSVVLALIGFLRWVFVVPPLADSPTSPETPPPGPQSKRHGRPSTSSAAHCSVNTSASCWPSAGRSP